MQSVTLLDMSNTLASVYVNCECRQEYETEMGPCKNFFNAFLFFITVILSVTCIIQFY